MRQARYVRLEYAQFSGSIHDIGLALWFFGGDCVVKRVSTVGITAVSPELRKYNHWDNAVGVAESFGEKIECDEIGLRIMPMDELLEAKL